MRFCFILAMVIVALAFQNCSQKNFTMVDPSEKNGKLESQNVFGDGSGEVPVNGGRNNGNVPGRGGRGGDGDVDAYQGNAPYSAELPLKLMCSTSNSQKNSNLSETTSLRVDLHHSTTDALVCRFTSTTLAQTMLSNRKLPYATLDAGCPSLAPGRYTMSLQNTSKASGDMVLSGEDLEKTAHGWRQLSSQTWILSDYNPNNLAQLTPSVSCDDKASPLVIHLHSDVEAAEPLVLTSQDQGVLFDILGRRADPVAHTKMQISWHRSKQYLYITLPDSRGRVNGIDQLFGDNTFGPDGKFSSDGFAALAKFDGMSADGKKRIEKADGYITDADPIFEKLRLWQDRNFDGVAQASELKSMRSLGLTLIDLNYDAKYREVDSYGNETMYKSVVMDRKGKLHLLFDVWFKYQTPKPVQRGLASIQD